MDTKQRTKWSLTGIGVFGAVIFAMIGIPGFVDDVKAWKHAIDQARLSNTDSTTSLLIALGFVLVAIAPWVLPDMIHRVRTMLAREPRTNPALLSNAKKLDGGDDSGDPKELYLRYEKALSDNAELVAQRDDALIQRDRERGDKETLARENSGLQFTIQNREERLRQIYWMWRFGHEQPIVPELPISETEAIRLRTQELTPALTKATGQFEALFADLLNKVRSSNQASGLPWLADYLGEHALRPMSIAWNALVEALDGSGDIRCHVITFCWNYSEAKMRLIRVLELLQWPADVAVDYERWREADKLLDGELERLLARNSMRHVRQQIKQRAVVDAPEWPA